MQAKVRYLTLLAIVLACAALLTILRPHQYEPRPTRTVLQPSLSVQSLFEKGGTGKLSTRSRRHVQGTGTVRNCTMYSCFDFTRCSSGFKVSVYDGAILNGKMSPKYQEILNAIKQSRLYTPDVSQACVLVVAIDTLDRDKLSSDYVHNVAEDLKNLDLWNDGLNHLVFNLYSGTWPDYLSTDLGFELGYAMIAQASMPQKTYRVGFDLSFPLYHDDHPAKGGLPGYVQYNNVPPVRQYTISFKGKRYVYGIGSESRNALYHIHNNKDIILVTTCKHKGTTKEFYDERCADDEKLYDKWDYKVLMHNSTFCLVPRGRRLASYRFLESLQAGCIPVLLSNEYVLPYSDVIDWSRAAIWADERLLFQIPSLMRSVSHTDILALRQQTQFLWTTYFSSVQKIVHTTLEVLAERVARHFSWPVRSVHVWNSHPGALMSLPEYSPTLTHFPFYKSQSSSSSFHPQQSPSTLSSPPHHQLAAASAAMLPSVMTSSRPAHASYTAVIVASTSSPAHLNSPLYRLLKNLAKSQYLHQILLLWTGGGEPPDVRWSHQDGPHVSLIVKPIQSVNERFTPFAEIQTSAVLALDDNTTLTADQADFGFSVWSEFSERLVGYTSRTHYWHDTHAQWVYSSRPSTHYSMMLPPALFYHKYYGYALQHALGAPLVAASAQHECHDILLNFLVTHATRQPPIRLAQRTHISHPVSDNTRTDARVGDNTVVSDNRESNNAHVSWHARQRCMHVLSEAWGDMPLMRSEVRVDPVLYRDDVSIIRKRYRQLEHLNLVYGP